MQDINLIHPLTAAIAAGATVAVVDDVETAIAWLDTHGGTQSLTRTGDTIAGVFLGIEFSIRMINKTTNPTHTMNEYSEYTVYISNEPTYYGSDCSQPNTDRIVENLSSLIGGEFPGIQIREHFDGHVSGKTTGPDDAVVEEINDWIANNWTAAL